MYYILTRAAAEFPVNTVLSPFLNVQLPDGVGMTFDEVMVGTIADADCTFDGRMVIRDVNEFVDGLEHEASIQGTMKFANLDGKGAGEYVIDESASRFHYLKVNPATAEAEMNYHIEFATPDGTRYTLDGTKFMQKDSNDPGELLRDYTTLFCTLTQGDRTVGEGVLKFRTFEDLAAVGSLAQFLISFQITGTNDPLVQFQARMRFLAFTGQFVQREYDPLGWPGAVPDKRMGAGG
jgi:hypothetical protein